MPVEHRLSPTARARWRARFAIDWEAYWQTHRLESELPNRDAVDASISWAVEKVLADRGEEPRGCSAGLIKKFRTEGTAVPAKAAVSLALASVLADPELHDLWSAPPEPSVADPAPLPPLDLDRDLDRAPGSDRMPDPGSGTVAPDASGLAEPVSPSGPVTEGAGGPAAGRGDEVGGTGDVGVVGAVGRVGDGDRRDDDRPAAGPAPTPAGAGVRAARRRPTRWLVPAVVVAVLGLSAAAVLVARQPDPPGRVPDASPTGAPVALEGAPPTAGTTPPGPVTPPALVCAGAPGDLAVDLQQGAARADWARSLAQAHLEAGGEAVVGCVTGPAELDGDTIVQQLAVDGGPGGVLLSPVDAPQSAWWFSRSFWGNYHQVFGKARAAVGVPASGMVVGAGGLVEVTTSLGGVFVAEREDAPFYLVSHLHVPWWRSHPELGRPTSHPDPALAHQDFERGFGSLRDGALVDAEATLVADPAAELPPGPLEGHILRQGDTTTWWVPEPGVRRWIPDGDTWLCLGGEREGVMFTRSDGEPLDVPGYAVATLRFDGIATCPTD